MRIPVPPSRQTAPIYYEMPDGHKFVQFTRPNNITDSIELPDEARLLTLADLLKGENAAA